MPEQLLYGVGNIWVGDNLFVWLVCGEAPWVPGFAAVVGVSDSPLAAVEVQVADGAGSVGVWDALWLHDGV